MMNTLKYLPHLFTTATGTNNEAQTFLSRGGQVIVRMRGLPYDCTAQQVVSIMVPNICLFFSLFFLCFFSVSLIPASSNCFKLWKFDLMTKNPWTLTSDHPFSCFSFDTDWIFFLWKGSTMWCNAWRGGSTICEEVRWKSNRRCLRPVWDRRSGTKSTTKASWNHWIKIHWTISQLNCWSSTGE